MAGMISTAVTAAVRIPAVAFGWTFPEQRAFHLRNLGTP